MRIKNLFRNSFFSMLSQFALLILGFFSQRAMNLYMGAELVGMNGVISNVINILSVTELGISTAIVYHLYGALARKDEAEIATAGGEQTGGAAKPSAKPSAPADSKTVTGKITDIKSSVNDGNTVYYLQVDGVYYYIRVTDCMQVLLLQKGDTVEITPQGDAKDGFAQAAAVKAK